ncbi:SDR family NAD(P)-dependent oxidoreductase [Saccharopolyspora sp. HNM0986]|nr:SDR family NAD(P)-dependent oxidoreductase [Saccharopolyspora sp. HNM0986]
MELSGARIMVTGATGVLGGKIAARLARAGARLAVAGRNEDRLQQASRACEAVAAITFDAGDPDSCTRAVEDAAVALGELDGLVVAHGVAAFGDATEVSNAIAGQVLIVNALAPMALARAALPHLVRGGTIAVVSAVLADYPTAGMSDYSASKGAVSTWLSALRRETRRLRITVCDLRPPHMDTGLADRALAGVAPNLPPAHDSDEIADEIVNALRRGATELFYDPSAQLVQTR